MDRARYSKTLTSESHIRCRTLGKISMRTPLAASPSPDQSSLSHPDPMSHPTDRNQETPATPLRIATRESPLAMWQARHVAKLLSQHDVDSKIVSMVSSGDVDMRPIDGKRSVGVFTKRIQQALVDDEGDVAVHSLKDLPTEPHPMLQMAASPERETVADCLVSPQGVDLDSLPKDSVIGTGSRRRAAQLLKLRPDLQILPIRGNVQTRLEKMRGGQYDAIILAAAGIERLEMFDLPRFELPIELMLPAPGQGALAIEVRRDNANAVSIISKLNDPRSAACTLAERTLLSDLHGGCLAPIAALATITQETKAGAADGTNAAKTIHLIARVLSLDGKQCLEAQSDCSIELGSGDWRSTSIQLGQIVGAMLIDQGAKPLIEAGR